MPTPPIPESLLAEHPEMQRIAEALEAFYAGRAVTSTCPTCGHVLTVTDFPKLGSCWVTCDTGCTRYHQKYEPEQGD